MPLKIGLTYDLESDYPADPENAPDANSEFDSVRTIKALKKGIKDAGYILIDFGNFGNLLKIRESLKSRADIVFNISEGIKGRNREAQVPILLEYLNIPYIGSDALTMSLTLDKVLTKQILIANKIPTPFFFVYEKAAFNNLKLNFPMIVKPRWEGSSMGINSKSVVYSKSELEKRANFIMKQYRQPALVEEFIIGSEYTVPVIGNSPPETLEPLKVKLNGMEMDNNVFDNSFIRSEGIDYVPLTGREKLKNKLRRLALKTYNCVECLDFGRIDFRVNNNGEIFVLELNPLPALNTDDALAVSAKHIGWKFSELLDKIIKAALMRYKMVHKTGIN